MRKESVKKEYKLLSQCPDCLTVRVLWPDGTTKQQNSIAKFEKLPAVKCYLCQNKKQSKM